MYEFAVDQPVTVAVKLAGGLLEIVAEERNSATVEVLPWDNSSGARQAAEEIRVELTGDQLLIEAPSVMSGARWLLGRSSRVRVRVVTPLDSPLELKVASADIRCQGRFGPASVNTASGDVQLAEVAGSLVLTGASGDIEVKRVAGTAEVHTASGGVQIGEVGGDLSVVTASGDTRVRRCGGSVRSRSASGDVLLEWVRQGEVQANSASGDVQIGVQRGTGVWLDLNSVSGSTSSDLAFGDGPAPEGEQSALTLRIRTVSGDIRVYRSDLAAAA